jgi:hypothetical protein
LKVSLKIFCFGGDFGWFFGVCECTSPYKNADIYIWHDHDTVTDNGS